MKARREKPDPLSDLELVERSRDGDSRAFGEVVRRYQGRVFGICFGIVRDREEARDTTQEVFIRAFRHLHKFKGDSSFYTWLYRIAVNLSISTAGKIQRKKTVLYGEFPEALAEAEESDFPTASAPMHPLKALETKELGQQVGAAMEKLSEKHRAVIVLREVEGLSYEEIAEAVDCSLGTVMSRLFHARKKIQKSMKRSREGTME